MEKDVKGQNNGFRDRIGVRKADALIRLKEIISDIGEVMILNEEDDDPEIYISTLAERDRLREFLVQVESYRSDYEMYLDMEAAAMVSYLHDYLCELRDFTKKYPNIPMFVTGILADRDIQMWSDEAEKIIIRDMNAASTEIEMHSGEEWEAVKDRICDELHAKTALYDLHDLPADTAGKTDASWLEWIEDFNRD